MKIFQARFIIGSIISILTTVLGTIAIFFPNIFNLQTKSIKEYTSNLATFEDAKNLYNFLNNNNNLIVKLNIKYNEGDPLTNDFSGDDYDSTHYDSNWLKKFVNKKTYQFYPDSSEPRYRISYSSFGEGQNFFAIGVHRYSPDEYNYRENSAISVWFGDRIGQNKCNREGKNKKPRDCENILMYQIYVPDKKQESLFFDWSRDSGQAWGEFNMTLSGIFFVNKYNRKTSLPIQFYNPDYYNTYVGTRGELFQNDTIFVLKAIDKKELNIKNY